MMKVVTFWIPTRLSFCREPVELDGVFWKTFGYEATLEKLGAFSLAACVEDDFLSGPLSGDMKASSS